MTNATKAVDWNMKIYPYSGIKKVITIIIGSAGVAFFGRAAGNEFFFSEKCGKILH